MRIIREGVVVLAATGTCLVASSAQAQSSPKFFARQHLNIDKSAASSSQDEPFPASGTAKQQVAWVDSTISKISAGVAAYTAAHGTAPNSIEEVMADGKLGPNRIGIPGGDIIRISYQRSWPWSPRWNTNQENTTWYYGIELTTVFSPFCDEWNRTHYNPAILNSEGRCSSYYGNHITVWN